MLIKNKYPKLGLAGIAEVFNIVMHNANNEAPRSAQSLQMALKRRKGSQKAKWDAVFVKLSMHDLWRPRIDTAVRDFERLGSRAAFVQASTPSLQWDFETRLGMHLLMQDKSLSMPQRTSIFNALFRADLGRSNVGTISSKAFDNQYRQSYQEDTKKGESSLAKDWQRVLSKRWSQQDRATEARLKKEISELKALQEAGEEIGVDDEEVEDEDEEIEGEGEGKGEDEDEDEDEDDEVEEQAEQEFESDVEQHVEDGDDDMQDVDEAAADMEPVEVSATEEVDELPKNGGELHYNAAENVGRWSWKTVGDSDLAFDLEIPGAPFCDSPTTLRRIRVQLERAGITDVWTQGINICATSLRETISASDICSRPQEGSVQETIFAQRTVLVEHVLDCIYHGAPLDRADWQALGCVETDGVLHPPGFPPNGSR